MSFTIKVTTNSVELGFWISPVDMEIEIGAGCQKSVEDIYEEYTMRRMAIVKALTTGTVLF